MHTYGVSDVEKLLHMPRRTLRALVAAGFVTPARGPRSAWQFSFQDLIVLRTAQALVDANVPPRRITQSLKQLRKRLPDSMPMSGLRIRAIGNRVVVSEREGHWQADSGQYLLAFEGDPAAGVLGVIEKKAPVAAPEQGWFEQAVALEHSDTEAARAAYERAIAAEPARADARLNLGRLLHEAGKLEQAGRVYREAVRLGSRDPLLYFNLGVLLEDMDHKAEAMQAYEAALAEDPNLADGHYNLALLYEESGRAKDAIRHMARYRKLTQR